MLVELAELTESGEKRLTVAAAGKDDCDGHLGRLPCLADAPQQICRREIVAWSVRQREQHITIRAEIGALHAVECDDRKRSERLRSLDLGLPGQPAEDNEVGVLVVGAGEPSERQLGIELDAVLVRARHDRRPLSRPSDVLGDA